MVQARTTVQWPPPRRVERRLAALRQRRDRAAAWHSDVAARTAQVDRLQELAVAAAERLPSMVAAHRKQVLALLDVTVRVVEWHLCQRCVGSGRVSDAKTPGGVTCPACSGNRWLPSLHVTGAVHDSLLATIGGQERVF